MKLKSYWAIIPLLISIIFVACDDDLNPVGGSVQPPSDDISIALDSIPVNARTISMEDSVYARTINGVLGKYHDDVFGTIKADYLAQFYYPEGAKFEGVDVEIDSVNFIIDFTKYTGDTISPMGLSIYEVNKPLVENFYTNANPADYCDLSKVLAKQAFTIAGTPTTSSSTTSKFKRITADLGNDFGKDIYNAYEKGIIKDSKSFNEFFKGVYVTTTFGSTSMINVQNTALYIYYKYRDVNGNFDNTQDTIRTSYFALAVTPEIIQLNHIENSNPQELFIEGTGSTYLKTPAGVYTEVVFPIKEIAENMKKKNMANINSAQFLLNGDTQKEINSKTKLERPNYLLLIDKDSVNTFFTKRQLPTGIGSFTTTRNATYNTYTYSNISSLISNYIEKGVEDVTFLLIPVDISIDASSGTTTGVYNYLSPSSAILRSNEENMKLNLIYSKL